MKIKRVLANNKKKCFVIETKNTIYSFPYSELKHSEFKLAEIKHGPSAQNPVVSVYVDPELANEGFTYKLKSGKEESILMDQVLDYNEDPEYLREILLHNLTVVAINALKLKKISKRELSRKLKTSPRQLYRLLDPAYYGKTIDAMVKLLHALGKKVEFHVEKKAA